MSTFWLIVAVIFGIGELMTTSLTLIWFSIGALVLMVFSIFIESILLQIVLFSIISITLLVVATKYLIDKDKRFKYSTNLQGIISKKGVVIEEIEPHKVGVVKLNSEKWSAIAVDDKPIEVGKIVRVIKIEGVKLVVEEVKEDN